MTRTRILPVLLALVLTGAANAFAQDVPSTDVYLVSVKVSGEKVELGEPVNVTARPGYDNQPHFLPDGRSFVYTVMDGEGSTDVWSYELETRQRSRVTETPESEYSPTPIPGEDAISVIRVEADETQRLWRFPLGGGEGDLILPDIRPVGYHAWSSERDLALFVLGEPPELQYARQGPGPGKVLAKNIGRALHRVPGSTKVSFVHKESESDWTIREIDLASGEMAPLAATRPGKEDFTWLGERLLMGEGSRLYVTRPGSDGWREVADFEDAGLSEITRIAVHPETTWIAFVAIPSQ